MTEQQQVQLKAEFTEEDLQAQLKAAEALKELSTDELGLVFTGTLTEMLIRLPLHRVVEVLTLNALALSQSHGAINKLRAMRGAEPLDIDEEMQNRAVQFMPAPDIDRFPPQDRHVGHGNGDEDPDNRPMPGQYL